MTVDRFLLLAAATAALFFLLRLMRQRWMHLASLLERYVQEHRRR